MAQRAKKSKSRKKVVVRYRTATRSRVSGFDLGTDVNIAVLVGIGIGAYFLYQWLEGDSGSANTNTAASTTASSDVQAQTNAGNPPNFSQTQYASWASTIFQAGDTFAPLLSNPSAVLPIFQGLKNLADIYSLIQAFGQQEATGWSFSATSYDLPSFIHAGFEDSDIATFNQALSSNGIQYQF